MNKVNRFFLSAMILSIAGNWMGSTARASDATPWDSYRLYLQGLLEERAGRTAQAIASYQEALRRDPNAEFLKQSLAGLYSVQSDTAAAINAFEIALEENPENLEVLAHLGQLYYLAGRFQEAQEVLTQALLLAPQNPTLHFWRALVAQEEGKWEDAVLHMKQAAKLNPDPGSLLRLATYYGRLGQTKESIRVLNRLHRLQPDNPDFMYFLALAYEDREKPRSAIRWLNRALAISPDQPELYFHLALNWDKRKRFDKVEEHLLKAIEQDPHNALALNYLGYSWVERNTRLPEALGFIERAVAQDPQNQAYRDSLGWAYFRLGRSTEAATVLSSTVYAANDPVVWSHYGDVLMAVGNPAEAVRAWQEGLLLSPNDKELLKRLGEEGRPTRVAPLSAPRTLLKRVEGNFRQVGALSGLAGMSVRVGGRAFSGQGLFYYSRPNLFRLEVLGPFLAPQAVLIYDGKAHWTPAINTTGDEGPWLDLWARILSGDFFKGFDDPSVQVRQEGARLVYSSPGGELRLNAREKSVEEAKIFTAEGNTVVLKFRSPREEEGLLLPRVVEGESQGGGFRFTLQFSRLSVNPALKKSLFLPAP